MGFEIREHTADVAIEAVADDLDGLFAAMGDGMAACMIDAVPDDAGERFELAVEARDLEALLFDYLDELIYQRDVRDVMPVDNAVRIEPREDGYTLEGSARGVPLAGLAAREVKAVTYADMVIEETDAGWRGYVVLDV